MLRKLFTAVGLISANTVSATPPYAPYASTESSAIYNLLFCDDSSAFQAKPDQKPAYWQSVLALDPPDITALEAIATDQAQEGRIRYLAYRRLKRTGKLVPKKLLLGVIIEVPLEGGLDTLAAYSEGGVRYVNQSGKLVIVEGIASFAPLVERLFVAAQPVVNTIGPWDKERLGPPARGNVRLTFLVSDGLYFGEGPLSAMQRDKMAAPVIQAATALLQATVAAGTK